MNMMCNFETCRYNKLGKCTNSEKRIDCVETSKAVLCEDGINDTIKIVSDGAKAFVFINGERKRCTDLEFIGNVSKEPIIRVDVTWQKEDENGNPVPNDEMTEVLTEGMKINC